MVTDLLTNWKLYPYSKAWEKAINFLKTLGPGVEEKEYEIQGKDIFARVMSYDTCSPQDSKLEAHKEYADIQMVLLGAEGIEWFPIEGLREKTNYDSVKDVTFYQRPHQAPARADVYPGRFCLLFPTDAHMPKLSVVDQPTRVKKVVIKIKAKLLIP